MNVRASHLSLSRDGFASALRVDPRRRVALKQTPRDPSHACSSEVTLNPKPYTPRPTHRRGSRVRIGRRAGVAREPHVERGALTLDDGTNRVYVSPPRTRRVAPRGSSRRHERRPVPVPIPVPVLVPVPVPVPRRGTRARLPSARRRRRKVEHGAHVVFWDVRLSTRDQYQRRPGTSPGTMRVSRPPAGTVARARR